MILLLALDLQRGFSTGFLQFSLLHKNQQPISSYEHITMSVWTLFRISRVNKNYIYIYFSEAAAMHAAESSVH